MRRLATTLVGRAQARSISGLSCNFEPARALSKEQIKGYHADGYLLPEGSPTMRALGPEQARRLRQNVEALEAREMRPARVLLRHGHTRYPWLHRLVTSGRILDAIEDIIGPDILVWSVSAFIKEPGSESYIGWHQDANYWGLRPLDSIVTAWVALSDVGEHSGPMEFLRGSHLEDTYDPNSLLSRGQEIAWPEPVDRQNVVRAVMQAGEFSLHHVKLAHASQPNRGVGRRIGLAIRYMPPCTFSERGMETAMLVRGEDHFGHFQLEKPPAAEDHPMAILQWQRGFAMKEQNVISGANKVSARLA